MIALLLLFWMLVAMGTSADGWAERLRGAPQDAEPRSDVLQVRFVFIDPEGVTLSCAGRDLGQPDCPARSDAACWFSTQVAPGQSCVAEKGTLHQRLSYRDPQQYPRDRQNRIHVLVYFFSRVR